MTSYKYGCLACPICLPQAGKHLSSLLVLTLTSYKYGCKTNEVKRKTRRCLSPQDEFGLFSATQCSFVRI
jgi:hypothetical protein